MKNNLLKRYWIKFEFSENLGPLNLGCGVTAFTYEDAISLLQERVFRDKAIPTIVSNTENIDISTLDKGHVLLNMGVVTERGIWFPLGYVPIVKR